VTATEPAIRERYEFATSLDEQRLRIWTGEPVNLASPDGNYALFTVAAAGAVAPLDAEIVRCFLRRMGLLDSTAVLDDDTEMQGKIESLFKGLLSKPRAPLGPSIDEMRHLLATARSST